MKDRICERKGRKKWRHSTGLKNHNVLGAGKRAPLEEYHAWAREGKPIKHIMGGGWECNVIRDR